MRPGGALHSTHRISTQRAYWIGSFGQRLPDRPRIFHRHRRALGQAASSLVGSNLMKFAPLLGDRLAQAALSDELPSDLTP